MKQLLLEDFELDVAPQRPPSPASRPPRPVKRENRAPARVPPTLLAAMPLLDGAELKDFLCLAANAEGPDREVSTLGVAQIALTTGLFARSVQKVLGALDGRRLACRRYQPGKRTIYRVEG